MKNYLIRNSMLLMLGYCSVQAMEKQQLPTSIEVFMKENELKKGTYDIETNPTFVQSTMNRVIVLCDTKAEEEEVRKLRGSAPALIYAQLAVTSGQEFYGSNWKSLSS